MSALGHGGGCARAVSFGAALGSAGAGLDPASPPEAKPEEEYIRGVDALPVAFAEDPQTDQVVQQFRGSPGRGADAAFAPWGPPVASQVGFDGRAVPRRELVTDPLPYPVQPGPFIVDGLSHVVRRHVFECLRPKAQKGLASRDETGWRRGAGVNITPRGAKKRQAFGDGKLQTPRPARPASEDRLIAARRPPPWGRPGWWRATSWWLPQT